THAMRLAAKEGGILNAVFVGFGGVANLAFGSTEIERAKEQVEALTEKVTELRNKVTTGKSSIPFLPFDIQFNDEALAKLKGTLAEEITVRQTDFVGELRGVMQPLQQTIGRVYSKRCDADLGDTRCGVALGPFTVTGTAAANRSRFTASAVPSRPHGKLTWTSGANVGLSMEVKSLSGSEIRLILPMPYDIAVSDAYSVYAGCDKRQSTCIATFNNIINFRGFPFIPGQDKVLRYPDAHS
ncbi:MAG: DUF2163 domain-containing protein, partial [Gammaproteobacteria bacterium]